MVSTETSHDGFTAIETFYSLLHELNKLQNLTSGWQVFLQVFLIENCPCSKLEMFGLKEGHFS